MSGSLDEAVAAVRGFNRFYTRFVGALNAHFLGSDLSLVEARVLYEIATREAPVACLIQTELGMDAGYLSRIVRRFQSKGWINRLRGDDARRRPILLTAAGREAFAALDTRQRAHVANSVEALGPTDRSALIGALGSAKALLGGEAAAYGIRTFRSGDMGLIASRQAVLYADSYGWGAGMEVLLGDVTTRFLRDFKPGREQCWVAERAGRMVGSVLLVDAGGGVAQLRLLYVEPGARGLGIGADLVGRCVALARETRYREIMLWTHSVLLSARKIYAAAGFMLASTETHDEFGEPVQGETWRLRLAE